MRRFGGRWVFLRRRKLNRASAFLPLLLLAGGTLRAGTVPGNLGSGLDALVQSNVKFNSAIQEGKTGQITLYNGYATQKAANAATLVINDSANRILVRVPLNGIVSFKRVGATFGSTSPGLTSQTAFIRNRIGAGYSALDGYGFINAQTAVSLPLQ